jgi:hypothetical protein
MNKTQFQRHLQEKISNSVNRQDKRFYKKRIVDLTRDMLSKPSFHESNILSDVKYAFDNYVKTCVQYFKTIDNSDILQEEYKNMDDETEISSNCESANEKANPNYEDINKLLMRSVKMDNSLDKFVKKKFTKIQEEPIIPKQKEIDLMDPVLKTKGIIKKKKKENIL